MADDWTPSQAVFRYARQKWKDRVAANWQTQNWNMWDEYNTTLNPDWQDVWFQKEVGRCENAAPAVDPETGTYRDDGYQICQNLYGVYCWLKYKGYHRYAMCGIMTHMIQESGVSGGAWEGGRHPYETYVDDGVSDVFNPENTSSTLGSVSWYTGSPLGGTIAPQWSVTHTDPNGYTHTKTAATGTWDATQKPLYWLWNYDPATNLYSPGAWNPSAGVAPGGWSGNGGGYGLVQWTLWTKLPQLANECAPNGRKHWQLSPVMQLMVMERERYWSVNPHPSGVYYGQWVSSHARQAGFQVSTAGTMYEYGANLPWSGSQPNYMMDLWVPWVNQTIATIEQTEQRTFTEAEKDWFRRQTAISFWDRCFEQYYYSMQRMIELDMDQTSLYCLAAIDYWDTLNQGNDYVFDIPHPRDIAFGDFELDYLHLPIWLLKKAADRRKRGDRNNARTILLR